MLCRYDARRAWERVVVAVLACGQGHGMQNMARVFSRFRPPTRLFGRWAARSRRLNGDASVLVDA
jgi:hypothetical protein